jgi:hypothetical protein
MSREELQEGDKNPSEQSAGEFLSSHPSGRPPLATAVVSELLSSILGDNDPRLVGLGPGCPGSHGIGTP